jgi:hypothetical protein
MIGFAGDYPPPSRFVCAVAWTQATHPLVQPAEANYAYYKLIIDNRNNIK